MGVKIPFAPHDESLDVKAALCEVAEVASDNAVSIDDLMKAIVELAAIIGGEE